MDVSGNGEKMLGEYVINGFDGMARRRHERKNPLSASIHFSQKPLNQISTTGWVSEKLPGNMAKRYLYPETNR